MHARIDVRFDVWIDEDKTLTLAALAESLSELELEATILEQTIQSLDEHLVEAYCGPKHARGNGTNRFQRAGTTTRSAITTAGEHELTLHHVRDVDASDDQPTYFRPIDDVVQFYGQKQYQEGISLKAVDRATIASYRDAVAIGDGFPSMPSSSTINRRGTDYGQQLTELRREQIAGTEAEIVIPDATKCFSQDDDRTFHNVSVTLGGSAERDATDTTVLDVSVDDTWEETATTLDEIDAIAEDATVVSDGEEDLVDAFVTDERVHQLDLVHLCRTTGYKLWEDGQFSLEERRAYVDEVHGDVFYLRNSVAKHAPAGEAGAIAHRIEQTRNRLDRLARQLERRNCPKTSTYLRKWCSSVVTFAERASDDVEVPWTSNVVERTMGEIAKRCKNQWMRWSEDGLEALLTLVLTRRLVPATYQAFVDDLIGRSTKTAMTCEVSVEAARGEL